MCFIGVGYVYNIQDMLQIIYLYVYKDFNLISIIRIFKHVLQLSFHNIGVVFNLKFNINIFLHLVLVIKIVTLLNNSLTCLSV